MKKIYNANVILCVDNVPRASATVRYATEWLILGVNQTLVRCYEKYKTSHQEMRRKLCKAANVSEYKLMRDMNPIFYAWHISKPIVLPARKQKPAIPAVRTFSWVNENSMMLDVTLDELSNAVAGKQTVLLKNYAPEEIIDRTSDKTY